MNKTNLPPMRGPCCSKAQIFRLTDKKSLGLLGCSRTDEPRTHPLPFGSEIQIGGPVGVPFHTKGAQQGGLLFVGKPKEATHQMRLPYTIFRQPPALWLFGHGSLDFGCSDLDPDTVSTLFAEGSLQQPPNQQSKPRTAKPRAAPGSPPGSPGSMGISRSQGEMLHSLALEAGSMCSSEFTPAHTWEGTPVLHCS